ncbi:hypothetical protein NT2_05_01770 [Caenibius tardaugens NBRC 16725]|uniref:Uncharacterized protein n=1 Tax=Caenibius tardaugens NBRC 16725 TaxID=1219035 RepID=U2YLI1_9SPHN|nr:hypothetical protein [Caenibius tardaugens]AZI36605.1 hypothetical protein EGO55_12120 [Caenibius tardaugens NBRC 16725]GAD49257.1 hypothetical protein NT2_05_01770 [Caenibius tardaugens NBRC 16725]
MEQDRDMLRAEQRQRQESMLRQAALRPVIHASERQQQHGEYCADDAMRRVRQQQQSQQQG